MLASSLLNLISLPLEGKGDRLRWMRCIMHIYRSCHPHLISLATLDSFSSRRSRVCRYACGTILPSASIWRCALDMFATQTRRFIYYICIAKTALKKFLEKISNFLKKPIDKYKNMIIMIIVIIINKGGGRRCSFSTYCKSV